MTTLTIERSKLNNYIKRNKEKIYENARQNTAYNEKGQATISKNDSWFNEDVWDEHFKRMDNK